MQIQKQDNMILHNKLSRQQLEEKLRKETFKRKTFSFYKYFRIDEPVEFRDALFLKWSELDCLGRIYIATEGINAQMSIPEHNIGLFLNHLYGIKELNQVPIKWAVVDSSESFYKLVIKVRKKIVADGLPDDAFDTSNVGKHLTAVEFHNALADPDALVVDMRNRYESEVGRFENAICPDVDTFREAIVEVTEALKYKKDKRVLLYCTGGIRCEKASAYFRHVGFTNVNQLYGGIIEYANIIKQLNIPSKFIGSNFVFDNRLGEDIDGQVISRCHICGNPSNRHTNCANDDCHLLFLQCPECAVQYEDCCSETCKDINHLPAEEKKKMRQYRHKQYSESKIFKSRLNPELMKNLKMMIS